MRSFFLLLISTALLASCQSSSKWETMKLYNGTPSITVINLGDSTHGHGDGTAYEGELMDSTGKVIGEYISWYVTVDMEKSDSMTSKQFSEKILTIVLNLGPDDEIIIQGGAFHLIDDHMIKQNVPARKRAIVGGTGKYRGIRGEVVPYRKEDGTYVHELIYKLD
jgi:hypothetical protein